MHVRMQARTHTCTCISKGCGPLLSTCRPSAIGTLPPSTTITKPCTCSQRVLVEKDALFVQLHVAKGRSLSKLRGLRRLLHSCACSCGSARNQPSGRKEEVRSGSLVKSDLTVKKVFFFCCLVTKGKERKILRYLSVCFTLLVHTGC